MIHKQQQELLSWSQTYPDGDEELDNDEYWEDYVSDHADEEESPGSTAVVGNDEPPTKKKKLSVTDRDSVDLVPDHVDKSDPSTSDANIFPDSKFLQALQKYKKSQEKVGPAVAADVAAGTIPTWNQC